MKEYMNVLLESAKDKAAQGVLKLEDLKELVAVSALGKQLEEQNMNQKKTNKCLIVVGIIAAIAAVAAIAVLVYQYFQPDYFEDFDDEFDDDFEDEEDDEDDFFDEDLD